MAHATVETYEKLESLMQGKSFLTYIDIGVIYPQIQNNPSTIYSFLLMTGYLKAVKKEQNFGGDYICEVALPNKEISYVYSKEILSQLENMIPISVVISIQEAIYTMDISALQKRLESFLLQTISFHDAANEAFYHGLILGLCAMMDTYDYLSDSMQFLQVLPVLRPYNFFLLSTQLKFLVTVYSTATSEYQNGHSQPLDLM